MKKLALLVLLTTGLAVNAQAVVTAGFEAGYLTDDKDAYWAGRVGFELKATTNFSHQLELEFGYTEHSESLGAGIGGKATLTPITVNYRAETTVAEKLGYYFGAGAGQARASVKLTGSGVPFVSDSGNALALQAFAGLRYLATPTVTLHAGVKYLWVDDMKMLGGLVEAGDDFALTAGLSVKF